ncbi:SDR family oxidoreductase [Guptibacillus algicola]|uniref:SDR family oxidoreductase n=1 Tax=Guptibacillus algicola TaxID=225844 RepID=UPI001CD728BB|nr:SDR family oxidoreductase [Alkalihalobacillus algicola]MCA0988647.1 SDR family oxidoreductase [Alkalihalobacillus algicola]
MDLGLKGKSVVVTASSKGLGKATALAFAEEGAKVVISSRNREELQKACEDISRVTNNDNVSYKVCDVKNGEDIKELMNYAKEKNGAIHVLINNAGGPAAGGFEKFSDEDWQSAFELNLLSFVRTSRAAIPFMKKAGEGRIVNIASSSIKQSLDNLILSNTFRAGIVGLAKSLSQEYAEDNILVNTVGPGRIATERVEQLDGLRADKLGVSVEELKEKTERSIPIKRYGEPDEFAKMLVFLGSGANTYVTGQSLVVDGGLVKAL